MYDVIDVCRHIINYSNKKKYSISNLKLQKLLYFVQAMFLINDIDQPCFDDDIEAWAFGPVVPRAYYEYRVFGSSSIPSIFKTSSLELNNGELSFVEKEYKDPITPEDSKTIDSVIDEFKNYSASDLVRLTHSQLPWKSAYNSGHNEVISKNSIRSYFNGFDS